MGRRRPAFKHHPLFRLTGNCDFRLARHLCRRVDGHNLLARSEKEAPRYCMKEMQFSVDSIGFQSVVTGLLGLLPIVTGTYPDFACYFVALDREFEGDTQI